MERPLEKPDFFIRFLNYIGWIPFRVKKYGLKTMTCKVIVDAAIYLKFEKYIPNKIRWIAAHQFHTSWKIAQKSVWGSKEYNRRIDTKSREVLNNFYEVGTDFMHKTVVDVGCGTRGVLPIISAGTRIGIDPTIDKVRDKFDFPEGIIYISEKAEDITLPTESVDIVFCNNALNHFENDDLALAQMHRILRKGGYFMLEVFIEPINIAHTYKYNQCNLDKMITKYFKPIRVKYEPLKVEVEIEEKMDGYLPMRWGGVFQK